MIENTVSSHNEKWDLVRNRKVFEHLANVETIFSIRQPIL